MKVRRVDEPSRSHTVSHAARSDAWEERVWPYMGRRTAPLAVVRLPLRRPNPKPGPSHEAVMVRALMRQAAVRPHSRRWRARRGL